MQPHQTPVTARPRRRHAASRSQSGRAGTSSFYPLDEKAPALATHDWLGAAVLALSLLAGAGLVALIQLNPALLHALESVA